MENKEIKAIIDDVEKAINEYMGETHSHTNFLYKGELEKILKEVKKKYNLLPKYDTLREYVKNNQNGAYHTFKFEIYGKVIEFDTILEFEGFYNEKMLDELVVIKDEKISNEGSCENYHCVHTLTVEKADKYNTKGEE